MATNLAARFRTWWTDDSPNGPVFQLLDSLHDGQTTRSQNNLRYARLYGNMDVLGLSPTDYFRTSTPAILSSRLSLNIVRSCVDTVHSRIAKNKPRPQFLTSGGDWELQQKAKGLSKFVQGVFYETEFYDTLANCFRDSAIFGTGFIKAYILNRRIVFERALAEEITVDETESIYGTPQSLFQTKSMNRSVLLAKYGKDPIKKAAIEAADNIARPSNDTVLADMCRVVEAWHLPSSENGPDGKHVICIKNCTLFQEPYQREDFPFIVLRWSNPIVGYFGTGLAEELIGLQLEINKILRQIQLSQHLLSTPRWLVDVNSDIVSAHLNNEIGAIVKYRGIPPEVKAFATVNPEMYSHLERLYEKAFQVAGISAMSAQAKKPVGLDSAPALREFSDIESERFALVQQGYESAAMDASYWALELGREIVTKHGGFKVKAPNKKVIDIIDLANMDMEDEDYILQCFPTNFLPNTPAGRLQSVQELMQAGLIPKEVGLSLLDFPDLESAMSLANASLNDVMLHLDEIISKGAYHAPEPLTNLDLAQKLGQATYLKAKVDGVPKARLELLRRWISEVVRLQALTVPNANPANALSQVPANQPQAGAAPLGGMAPQAVPAPSPVSGLLPNAPA